MSLYVVRYFQKRDGGGEGYHYSTSKNNKSAFLLMQCIDSYEL